jgi:hypothetical protein
LRVITSDRKACSNDPRNNEDTGEMMMTMRFKTTALVFASVLGVMAALPMTAALANTSPNTTDNATSDDRCDNRVMGDGFTGIYDNFDRFRDETGRPCPGSEYLFFAPN